MALSNCSSLHVGIVCRQRRLHHLSSGTLGFASLGNRGKQLLLLMMKLQLCTAVSAPRRTASSWCCGKEKIFSWTSLKAALTSRTFRGFNYCMGSLQQKEKIALNHLGMYHSCNYLEYRRQKHTLYQISRQRVPLPYIAPAEGNGIMTTPI